MSDKTYWESFKAESATLADKLNDIIRQGNVRRPGAGRRGHRGLCGAVERLHDSCGAGQH